jgi:hypothetical protein
VPDIFHSNTSKEITMMRRRFVSQLFSVRTTLQTQFNKGPCFSIVSYRFAEEEERTFLKPHIELESLPTLDRAKEAFILNELWKHNIILSDRAHSSKLISETVKRAYPTINEEQAREIEKKIHRRMIEKMNLHRIRNTKPYIPPK